MINKMQKEYLEKRLSAIKNKKINEKFPQEPKKLTCRDYFELAKQNKLILKDYPTSESYTSPDLSDIFDLKAMNKEYYEYQDNKSKYENKLSETILKIMDKVMFEGLSIDEAMQSFENM